MWVVDVVWADYAWDGWWHLVGLRVNVFLFVWIACGRLVSFGQIARGRLALSLRYSARMPLRILFFYAFYFCSVYFFNG